MPQLTLEDVTPEFLAALIADQRREDQWLEFKRDLPQGNDKDRKDFAADVSAFANAAGGILFFGIEEAKDQLGRRYPKAVCGAAINGEAACLRLEQMARDSITPRIPGLRIRAVGNYSNGAVIAMEIPRSWIAPHMVALGDSRFFARAGAGRYPLAIDQIRDHFSRSESLPQRLRRFRDERLLVIDADEGPVRLGGAGRVVLHLVPLDSLNPYQNRDVTQTEFNRGMLQPLGNGFDIHRFNLDGYFTGTKLERIDGAFCGAYAQLFRSGAIEQVESRPLMPRSGQSASIAATVVEEELLRALAQDIKLYSALAVAPPLAILVSLVRVRDVVFSTDWREIRSFDRDVVRLPEVFLDDLFADLSSVMQPIFDGLWQAGGHEGSPRYSK